MAFSLSFLFHIREALNLKSSASHRGISYESLRRAAIWRQGPLGPELPGRQGRGAYQAHPEPLVRSVLPGRRVRLALQDRRATPRRIADKRLRQRAP